MNKESFVFYESVYKQIQTLRKRVSEEVANEFIEAIFRFGLYGEVPDEESDLWIFGFEQCITSIDGAKTRRNKSIEDGSKGGRPPKDVSAEQIEELEAQGMSQKEIAKELGVSPKTIQRRQKRHNLNVNDNVNCNANVNVNENENYNFNKDFSPSVATADAATAVEEKSVWERFKEENPGMKF